MKPVRPLHGLLLGLLLLQGCASAQTSSFPGQKIALEGTASYYGDKFHGRRTASGELHHQGEMTAAHRTLPFGTRVKVTNLKNKRSVVVTVNDRGPHKPGRIIDVSQAAARELGFMRQGLTRVRLAPAN